MSRRELTILLSVILLCCFFIPMVEWQEFEMSGFNFILSSHTPNVKYILLTGPVSAALLMTEAIANRKNIFGRIKRIIPLFAMLCLFIICYRNDPQNFSLQNIGIGYWITLIVSILLIFTRQRSDMYYETT